MQINLSTMLIVSYQMEIPLKWGSLHSKSGYFVKSKNYKVTAISYHYGKKQVQLYFSSPVQNQIW